MKYTSIYHNYIHAKRIKQIKWYPIRDIIRK